MSANDLLTVGSVVILILLCIFAGYHRNKEKKIYEGKNSINMDNKINQEI